MQMSVVEGVGAAGDAGRVSREIISAAETLMEALTGLSRGLTVEHTEVAAPLHYVINRLRVVLGEMEDPR